VVTLLGISLLWVRITPSARQPSSISFMAVWAASELGPAGHREQHDPDFLPVGDETRAAFNRLPLGMDVAAVEGAVGPPFLAPQNPRDPSGRDRVLDYAFRDGWIGLAILDGKVGGITASGIARDAGAYPVVQSQYARTVDKPILPAAAASPSSFGQRAVASTETVTEPPRAGEKVHVIWREQWDSGVRGEVVNTTSHVLTHVVVLARGSEPELRAGFYVGERRSRIPPSSSVVVRYGESRWESHRYPDGTVGASYGPRSQTNILPRGQSGSFSLSGIRLSQIYSMEVVEIRQGQRIPLTYDEEVSPREGAEHSQEEIRAHLDAAR
jgi:hypothetical protein